MSLDAKSLVSQRFALRLSQAELASALGVTARTVQRWEAGAPIPAVIESALLGLATKRLDLPKVDQARAMLDRPGIPGRKPANLANAMLFWSMADGAPIPTYNHERKLPPGTKMLCRLNPQPGDDGERYRFRTIGPDGTSPLPVYRIPPDCAPLSTVDWPWQPWMAELGLSNEQIRCLYYPDCVRQGPYVPPRAVNAAGETVPLDPAILEADLAQLRATIAAKVGTGD